MRYRLTGAILILALIFTTALYGCAGGQNGNGGENETSGDTSAETELGSDLPEGPYTQDTPIEDVKNDAVFGSYGRLIFPVQEGYMSGDTLGTLDLAWYNYIDHEKTVEIANYMYSHAAAGKTIFYDIYTDEEKASDPDKEDTGLFFFRGGDGAKTAVVNAGGGFAYVGAMQDSFPVALELSKQGFNAFALIYRPDADLACEDLARAIAFLHQNADELGIDMSDYSLWGGSAGARMADWVGTYGTAVFGEESYPKPAIVVTQYTGLSEVTGEEAPTYANVGTSDGIANYRVMQARIEKIKENGTDAEIDVFDGLPHGFGLGTGTVAEGWLSHAVSFWREHMKTPERVAQAGDIQTAGAPAIPDEIEEIPDAYFAEADSKGTLEDIYYDTYESLAYGPDAETLRKHAVVYLPAGYSEDEKYDVFYLMHGGWSDENSTLGTPEAPSSLKNVLDNAIENGEMRPVIVVCPTYNNTNENGRDSDDFSLALKLTRNYHNELVNDLMPAVEGRYSTYADGTDKSDFAASRDHRGFGGFSMGSVATWRTFEYCLDYFRYFIPMSCGTSLDDEEIRRAADGSDTSDYFVFMMTGTSDFAYGYDSARAEDMEDSNEFVSVDSDPDGNFAFRVKEGYSHDAKAATEYIYNGLKAIF
ncbi:MAG: alpha/beta hydrolase-fold protein [Eubacterium sp.]|jgi:hypothetical protein